MLPGSFEFTWWETQCSNANSKCTLLNANSSICWLSNTNVNDAKEWLPDHFPADKNWTQGQVPTFTPDWVRNGVSIEAYHQGLLDQRTEVKRQAEDIWGKLIVASAMSADLRFRAGNSLNGMTYCVSTHGDAGLAWAGFNCHEKEGIVEMANRLYWCLVHSQGSDFKLVMGQDLAVWAETHIMRHMGVYYGQQPSGLGCVGRYFSYIITNKRSTIHKRSQTTHGAELKIQNPFITGASPSRVPLKEDKHGLKAFEVVDPKSRKKQAKFYVGLREKVSNKTYRWVCGEVRGKHSR